MEHIKTFVRYVLGLALDILIKRITRPHTVYTKLAVTALLLSGGAFITPFWQQALESISASLSAHECTSPMPSLVSGSLFLLLTALFAAISQRTSTPQPEQLVNTKSVSSPIQIGQSNVHCYCGSILSISGVDVIVASDNRDLDLGSISGTSVSGRIRRLAASFNSDGTLDVDHLFEHISQWKSNQSHAGPYRLGLCIPAPPFNATSHGVKSIVHAVALEKRDSGDKIIEESANREIIDFVIEHCKSNNYTSIFIPIFGLGSGGIPKDDAISKTLSPLIARLKADNHRLTVYVGTYRLADAASVGSRLLRA